MMRVLRTRIRVLLPEPFGPRMPKISPRATWKETSRSACTSRAGCCPRRRPMSDPASPWWKVLLYVQPGRLRPVLRASSLASLCRYPPQCKRPWDTRTPRPPCMDDSLPIKKRAVGRRPRPGTLSKFMVYIPVSGRTIPSPNSTKGISAVRMRKRIPLTSFMRVLLHHSTGEFPLWQISVSGLLNPAPLPESVLKVANASQKGTFSGLGSRGGSASVGGGTGTSSQDSSTDSSPSETVSVTSAVQ